jgi:hypothetical protein
MKELVTALMVWASAYTGLPVPTVEPIIVRMERCQMHRVLGAECPPDDAALSIRAFTIDNTVFLRDDWKPDTPYAVAVLLHELVHVLQFHAAVPKEPCFGQTWEKAAYEAHFAFLSSMKLDPMKESNLNALVLMMATTCHKQEF